MSQHCSAGSTLERCKKENAKRRHLQTGCQHRHQYSSRNLVHGNVSKYDGHRPVQSRMAHPRHPFLTCERLPIEHESWGDGSACNNSVDTVYLVRSRFWLLHCASSHSSGIRRHRSRVVFCRRNSIPPETSCTEGSNGPRLADIFSFSQDGS